MEESGAIPTQHQEEAHRPAQIERSSQGDSPVSNDSIEVFTKEKAGQRDEQCTTPSHFEDKKALQRKHCRHQEEETQSKAHPDKRAITSMDQHIMQFQHGYSHHHS